MTKRITWLLLILSVFTSVLIAPATTFAADTNNFSVLSFEADYYLSKNSENHSVMRVEEKIVAALPNYDQNHGIERYVPEIYDGRTVKPQIESIKDETGASVNYTNHGENNYKVLRIGDPNNFAHGQHTYVITYKLQDVTKQFKDHDEFYWDINGTEGVVPFESVVARLHIPNALASSLQAREPRCFTGTQNSTAYNCNVTVQPSANETVISASTNGRLAAHENMSIVVGFQPHTFSAYVPEPVSARTIAIFTVLLVAGLVWYIIVPIIVILKSWGYWRRYGRDPHGKGTIIPEYIPPKNVSVVTASVVLKDSMPTKAVTAQLLDLAIRHYIKLYELDKKKYEIELIKSPDDLQPEEQAVLELWFGKDAQVGARQKLASKDQQLYTKVRQVAKLANNRAHEQQFMQDVSSYQKKLTTRGWILFALSVLTFNLFGAIAAIITLVFSNKLPARTETGVTLRDYLYGLELYMKTAEADRIKQLQAPDTAEKIDVNDTQQLVKLYEKLLPYAMLFGIEKQWAEQFAGLYTQPPDWYSGDWSAFNAGVFAGSLASLNNSTLSTLSPPSSSSSSGFSDGGGFSGGGGGGGGVGGW